MHQYFVSPNALLAYIDKFMANANDRPIESEQNETFKLNLIRLAEALSLRAPESLPPSQYDEFSMNLLAFLTGIKNSPVQFHSAALIEQAQRIINAFKPITRHEPVLLDRHASSIQFQSPKSKLFSFSTWQIAAHLTMRDQALMLKLNANEFVKQGWNKADSSRSPNLKALIEAFNWTSSWTQTEILRVTDLPRRAEFIQRFCELAEELLRLNNFSRAYAVIAGLSGGAVSRLGNTWAVVTESVRNAFNTLKETISPLNNFRFLRERVFVSYAGERYSLFVLFNLLLIEKLERVARKRKSVDSIHGRVLERSYIHRGRKSRHCNRKRRRTHQLHEIPNDLRTNLDHRSNSSTSLFTRIQRRNYRLASILRVAL